MLFIACTGTGPSSQPEPASAAAAVDAIVAALNDPSAGGLEELAAEDGADPQRFIVWLEQASASGRIESVEFREAGPVPQPAPSELVRPSPDPTPGAAPTVTAPYEVEWVSEAAAEPALLEGELELVYDAGADAWRVRLEKDLLWPGHDGARRVGVQHEWLRRGRVLDRSRRVLARGPADERRYPHGATGGMTIGHIGVLTREDLRQGAVGDRGDLAGASGLELAYQERLAGDPTTSLVLTGRKGKVVATLGESPGKKGKDVRTTLDIRVQRAAEGAYGSMTGAAVVMAPASGDLLALVSSGSFAPGNYVGTKGIEPFNRAVSGRYPPGSSMKVLTAAAALEEGTVKPGTTVTGPEEYKGVRNFELGVFGSIPFSSAVKFSVNTAFAQVAEDLGARRLTRYADAFGFNEPEPMPLAAGTSSFPKPEHLGDLMWASIGQAEVLATPLQMASVVATIANKGKRMTPRSSFREAKRGSRVVSRKTARRLTAMMEDVVQGGTGTGARIDGVRVAGKTGTAEVDLAGERENHAWFVAFAPAGAPKVAIAVVGEYAGVGGQVAAPIARSILQSVLPLVR